MAKKPKTVSADTTVRLSKINRDRLEVCRQLLLEEGRKREWKFGMLVWFENMSFDDLIGHVIDRMLDSTAASLKREFPKQPIETDIRFPLEI